MQRKYETVVADFWNSEKKMEVWTEIELLNLECYDPDRATEARKAFHSKPDYAPWLGMEQQVRLKEKEIGHEVEAFVQYLNSFYRTGLWHKGLASSDLVECWTAWAVRQSELKIMEESHSLYADLWRMAEAHREEVTNGFTHGQMAEPTTWGMRYRMWAEHVSTCPLVDGPSLGKVSGAIGTGVVTHPDLEKKVARYIGFEDLAAISSQIVPRSALAAHLDVIGQLVMGAEKIANDLRLLYTLKQIDISKMPLGSSSMPHKVNPYELERVIGMVKMVMSMIDCVNRTNADNWLERDLVHSSVEREFLPMIFNHAYYALALLRVVLERVIPVVRQTTADSPQAYSSIALAKILQHDSNREQAREEAKAQAKAHAEEYEVEVRHASKRLIPDPGNRGNDAQ